MPECFWALREGGKECHSAWGGGGGEAKKEGRKLRPGGLPCGQNWDAREQSENLGEPGGRGGGGPFLYEVIHKREFLVTGTPAY